MNRIRDTQLLPDRFEKGFDDPRLKGANEVMIALCDAVEAPHNDEGLWYEIQANPDGWPLFRPLALAAALKILAFQIECLTDRTPDSGL
jgi:hypothetical protein